MEYQLLFEFAKSTSRPNASSPDIPAMRTSAEIEIMVQTATCTPSIETVFEESE